MASAIPHPYHSQTLGKKILSSYRENFIYKDTAITRLTALPSTFYQGMPSLLNCLSWLDTVKELILQVVGHYGVGVWAQGQGEGGLIRNPAFNRPVFPRARPIQSPQRKGPDTSAEDKPNSQPTQGNSWRPPQTKTCLSPFPAQTHPDVMIFKRLPRTHRVTKSGGTQSLPSQRRLKHPATYPRVPGSHLKTNPPI